MIWRSAAWLFALALAVGGFWWLDNWIASQAWATWDPEGWRVIASGWSVLRLAFPLALAGIIPGALLAWYFLDHAAEAAARADYQERLRGIETERQRLQAERQRVEEQKRELNQEHSLRIVNAQRQEQAARASQEAAEQVLKEAATRVARAENHAASADRRRQNATAAAARMRRNRNS